MGRSERQARAFGKVSQASQEKFTREAITWIHPWTDHLFSFRTTRPASFRFTAGQFARLGVEKSDGSVAWRAYSMVSGPYDEFLEFYSIVVPGGEFTSELSRLKVGDTVLIDKQNHGFLTLSRFQGGKDLWLLSTGTGIAPFLSILQDLEAWENFEHIVVAHSVRQAKELAYRELIESFSQHEIFKEHAHKLIYIPIVTRESLPGASSERLTALIGSGKLESLAGIAFDMDKSRFMLCGNPEMVDDTRQALKAKGFRTARQSTPGQIAVENYW
jgi:ferredoxin/flavodoxin---NADP+ reductase